MIPIRIDRLDRGDWQTLRDMRARRARRVAARILGEAVRRSGFSDQEWMCFIEAAAWFVARRDAMTTGLTGLTLPPAGEPHLMSMWVDPSERGYGVGALLTFAVLDLARTSGASSVGLWVTEGNDAARAMYYPPGISRSSAIGPRYRTMPPPANNA